MGSNAGRLRDYSLVEGPCTDVPSSLASVCARILSISILPCLLLSLLLYDHGPGSDSFVYVARLSAVVDVDRFEQLSTGPRQARPRARASLWAETAHEFRLEWRFSETLEQESDGQKEQEGRSSGARS